MQTVPDICKRSTASPAIPYRNPTLHINIISSKRGQATIFLFREVLYSANDITTFPFVS